MADQNETFSLLAEAIEQHVPVDITLERARLRYSYPVALYRNARGMMQVNLGDCKDEIHASVEIGAIVEVKLV